MLTPDEERWAEALAIDKWKGEDAGAFIAKRLETLGRAGDAAGVERFREIAWRLDALRAGQGGRA